jgi:hypothetical protein
MEALLSYTFRKMQRKVYGDCILYKIVVYMRIQQDLLYALSGTATKSS